MSARQFTIAAAIVAIVFVPVVIRLVLAAIVRPLALGFFLAGLVVGEDAEIMVGELEIVFGLHPVAIVLGVLGKLLVLFEQLRSIAPGTTIDPIGRIGPALIAVTASTTTVIAIIVQG